MKKAAALSEKRVHQETRGQRLDALEVLHKSDSRILVDRSGWAQVLKP